MLTKNQQSQLTLSAKANATGISLNSSMLGNQNAYWILDTDATNQMACWSDWLCVFKHASSKVQLLDVSNYVVHCVCNFKLIENRILRNVLYLSNFKYNLLSIAELTQNFACSDSFYPKLVIV